ncbi:putative tRNA (cytidine(32)/guanosine(34)-2'-O)-methyltransferase [Porphyridium purpureum]|uniref:Putative tRNA (cytidine(32)/guanosine(34)-2'-O)-methyltransferase n=1 Tax=Porphyridium purpureum TaxID=35688 RepID=A0A5J4YVM3_PORPP|nr:putative tRNA (cytidine(32)/guanosine(34)-2'-O)-methyltransferase [Porphyridium purpureum]|eukprot:POR0459..scf227_4
MTLRSKDKRDIYYRKAKELGYRARSAFKLLQIDAQFDLFKDVTRVIDLCAAPGSWSQVVARRMVELDRTHARVVAVDLQEMAPIPGVAMLQADITQQRTLERIAELLGDEKAEIIISDGAPDVTGVHDLDEYVQAELILAALNVALQLLIDGGSFVAKVFRQKDTDLLYGRLLVFFDDVCIAKPRSSRNSSIEAFVVCRGFRMPSGMIANAYLHSDPLRNKALSSLTGDNRVLVPFVSCGDLSGFDADMSYDLSDSDGEAERLPPVQAPIHPAYEEAKARLRLKNHGGNIP